MVLLVSGAGPAVGQADGEGPGLARVNVFAGGSLRQSPAGFGIGREVRSLSVRVVWPRQEAMQPWLRGMWFVRPEVECVPSLPCVTEGWSVLGGVVMPLTEADTRPGVHPYFVLGAGWAFASEDRFAYVAGLGTAVALTPWVAPIVEFRYEHLPGLENVLMLNLGVRLDLF